MQGERAAANSRTSRRVAWRKESSRGLFCHKSALACVKTLPLDSWTPQWQGVVLHGFVIYRVSHTLYCHFPFYEIQYVFAIFLVCAIRAQVAVVALQSGPLT